MNPSRLALVTTGLMCGWEGGGGRGWGWYLRLITYNRQLSAQNRPSTGHQGRGKPAGLPVAAGETGTEGAGEALGCSESGTEAAAEDVDSEERSLGRGARGPPTMQWASMINGCDKVRGCRKKTRGSWPPEEPTGREASCSKPATSHANKP